MSKDHTFSIAVLAGDGIGPEIIPPCLKLLDIAAQKVGVNLRYEPIEAGAAFYQKSGESIRPESLDRCKDADAILLAAMGLPTVRYPDGTEISPQLELREGLELYAGVRPIKTIPGLRGKPLADPRAESLDIVLIRESTEGLFAGRGNTVIENDEKAVDSMTITRSVSERLFDFAFKLGAQRKANGTSGRVSCIDKANVLGGFAFFRKIFDEKAQLHPDLTADHVYVDAAAYKMVTQPWEFDVMVTENMFGDILSDVGAAIMGGMGFAPSADIGDKNAVFQPCHGSAPDIAGELKANPTAMFLSAAMMLDWLGTTHNSPACQEAATLVENAVRAVFASGNLVPYEIGGKAGTKEISQAVFGEVQ
jgi:3-isopropylmalate dehydrogenase